MLGYLSQSEIDLRKKYLFEEDVNTYVLENDGQKILIVYTQDLEGFVFLKGRYIIPDPELKSEGFVYATTVREAWGIEKYGISKNGLILIGIYFLASLTAYLHEYGLPNLRIWAKA